MLQLLHLYTEYNTWSFAKRK